MLPGSLPLVERERARPLAPAGRFPEEEEPQARRPAARQAGAVRVKYVGTKSKIESSSYGSQKEIAAMAVRERAKLAASTWQNNCASRRLGVLDAQATPSSDLGGAAYTIQNCNYKLLKDNPVVRWKESIKEVVGIAANVDASEGERWTSGPTMPHEVPHG